MSPLPLFLSRRLDERFVRHRYRSTSYGGIAAALVMGCWSLYDLYVKDVVRWDFLIVLGVMALVKVAFMIGYQLRN
jgi:hypothetical protein